MKVLGIITARGGSKGVPRKNIAPLAGKPLLAYTAETALAAMRLSRVILSTDDAEIAAAGEALGLDVPFLRPAHLAMDDSPTLPVLQHAVETLERQGHCFDAICLLQPTNPFRRAADVDGCIALLEESDADAVVSVLAVPHEYNPHWVYQRDAEGVLHLSTGEQQPIPRRQDLPPAYHRDGSVYVMRRNVLMIGNSLYGARLIGYTMDGARSVNIDTPDDLIKAAELISSC